MSDEKHLTLAGDWHSTAIGRKEFFARRKEQEAAAKEEEAPKKSKPVLSKTSPKPTN